MKPKGQFLSQHPSRENQPFTTLQRIIRYKCVEIFFHPPIRIRRHYVERCIILMPLHCLFFLIATLAREPLPEYPPKSISSSIHSHLLLTGYTLIIAYFCSANNSLWTSSVKNRVNMRRSLQCHFFHSPQQSYLELSLKMIHKTTDGLRNSS